MGSIDVSIGLAPTLQLLAQYHQSGVLRASIPHLPGLRGAGVGVIEVIGGKIISCHVQNEKGKRRFLLPDKLVSLDENKGPFEWRFYTQQPIKEPAIQPQSNVPHAKKQPDAEKPRPLAGHDVPLTITNLNVDALTRFSPQQKRALRMTYAMIDGRRTLEDIEVHAPLPKGIVYETIVALIAMRVIVINAQ